LDIHKKYFVATGVDSKLNQVLGPHEAPIRYLERWAKKNLTSEDAVVLEMTTNTYVVYDTLQPLVHSVTVVHPPHVALIVRAQVKTDKKAALNLAQLHAAGLLPGVWSIWRSCTPRGFCRASGSHPLRCGNGVRSLPIAGKW